MAENKPVMIVGVDDSDHSFHALEWTIDHFFSTPEPTFRLVIVHAKPSPISAIRLAGPRTGDFLPMLEVDLNREAARVVKRAKKVCASKSLQDVPVEVVEGDARTTICESVDQFKASVLVVGSHGYGAIKRAVLGSVSDYLAHHAHCSVTIVKKSKPKN